VDDILGRESKQCSGMNRRESSLDDHCSAAFACPQSKPHLVSVGDNYFSPPVLITSDYETTL
jgi:hypothetical protein